MIAHIMLIGGLNIWLLEESVEVLLHIIQICETEVLEALVPVIGPASLVSGMKVESECENLPFHGIQGCELVKESVVVGLGVKDRVVC
jgi:hypothetical protein